MDTFGNPSAQTSGGYYAGIGYEQTESVHFEDLKAKQEILKMKAMEVAKEFKALAKMDRAAKKATAEKSRKRKERKDKAEKEGVNEEGEGSDDDDDDDDDDLELTMRCQSYCAARQEVMDLTRSWAQESANQIAAFPGQRSKERTKRTIDFINLIKIKLRKTAPIGTEDESPQDGQWLDTFTNALPEPDEMAAAAGEGKGLKGRLKGAANAMFDAINSPAKAFSSIRTSTPDTGKARGENTDKRKTRRRDEKGRYVKETEDKQDPPTKGAEPINNLADELNIQCPIKERDPNHRDCDTPSKSGSRDESVMEENEREEGEEERKEKEQKEVLLQERAADLIKLTGNLKLAKELKEADDKLKATRREAEEEAEKARREEERLAKEAEAKNAEAERKREAEEEELREILKQLLEMEKKESEKKEMAKRKVEMLRRKREEKARAPSNEEKATDKKKSAKKEPKAAAQGNQEEEEEEEEEERWQQVSNKKGKKSKKRRAKERAASFERGISRE